MSSGILVISLPTNKGATISSIAIFTAFQLVYPKASPQPIMPLSVSTLTKLNSKLFHSFPWKITFFPP